MASEGRLIQPAPHWQTAAEGPAPHPQMGGKSLALYPNIAGHLAGKQPRVTVSGKGPMPPPKKAGKKKKPNIFDPNKGQRQRDWLRKKHIPGVPRSKGVQAVHRALDGGEETPLPISAPATSVAEYINPGVPNSLVLNGPGWSIDDWASLNKTLDSTGDSSCLVCRDGGDLTLCDEPTCKRGLCKGCLGNPSPDFLELPFICPLCHREAKTRQKVHDGKNFVLRPYEGFVGQSDGKRLMFTSAIGARSIMVGSVPDSVLLLVYCLEGLALATTPVPMLVAHLQIMFPNNFAYMPVIFNMGEAEGRAALKSCNNALVKSLKMGALKSIRCIFTIIVSHTTPEGDIHYAPDNAWSDSPEMVMKQLIPAGLCTQFHSGRRRRSDNILVVITCGFMLMVSNALVKTNEWLVQSGAFHALIGFEAEKLQPEATAFVLIAVIKEFFYHRKDHFMIDCLVSGGSLGSHTGVVYLDADQKHSCRYLWAHLVQAPFGEPLVLSCPGCSMPSWAVPPPPSIAEKRKNSRDKGKVKALERKFQSLRADVINVHCMFCSHVRRFDKPADLLFMDKEDGGGVWVHRPLEL
ncbi:hypothetical protein B0H10DRAFT_2115752 [Mycena sp. CBHHK59/15]|nr:hypothetical protein B0H10DRAFT_2115752 [Mycena sp. CBHHK59/15]